MVINILILSLLCSLSVFEGSFIPFVSAENGMQTACVMPMMIVPAVGVSFFVAFIFAIAAVFISYMIIKSGYKEHHPRESKSYMTRHMFTKTKEKRYR